MLDRRWSSTKSHPDLLMVNRKDKKDGLRLQGSTSTWQWLAQNAYHILLMEPTHLLAEIRSWRMHNRYQCHWPPLSGRPHLSHSMFLQFHPIRAKSLGRSTS